MSDYAAHSPETSHGPPAGLGSATTPPHGDTLMPTRKGAVFCSFHGSHGREPSAPMPKTTKQQSLRRHLGRNTEMPPFLLAPAAVIARGPRLTGCRNEATCSPGVDPATWGLPGRRRQGTAAGPSAAMPGSGRSHLRPHTPALASPCRYPKTDKG